MATGDFIAIADKQTLEETKALIDTRANELKTQTDGIKADAVSLLNGRIGDISLLSVNSPGAAPNTTTTLASITGKGKLKFIKWSINGQGSYERPQFLIIADGKTIDANSLGVLTGSSTEYDGYYIPSEIPFKTSLVLKSIVGNATYGGRAISLNGWLELL
jgi:hypothetical protein